MTIDNSELYKQLVDLTALAADDKITSISIVATHTDCEEGIYFGHYKSSESEIYELIGAMDAHKTELIARYHESEYLGERP